MLTMNEKEIYYNRGIENILKPSNMNVSKDPSNVDGTNVTKSSTPVKKSIPEVSIANCYNVIQITHVIPHSRLSLLYISKGRRVWGITQDIFIRWIFNFD